MAAASRFAIVEREGRLVVAPRRAGVLAQPVAQLAALPDVDGPLTATEQEMPGVSVRDVAESLGVSQQSLRNWVKQGQLDRRERDDGLTSDEHKELREPRARMGM
jgi:hypothetical protein